MEKHIDNRVADVYFEMKDGKQVVIEIQHSAIQVKEIIERTEDYSRNNIYVMWILHASGSCVFTPKYPRNDFSVKVSPVELYLHGLFLGRVYYLSINPFIHKIKISKPYALYFTKTDIHPDRQFKEGFSPFYYRNTICTPIRGWAILCIEIDGLKIARFYDKNVKSKMIERIASFLKKQGYSDLEHDKTETKLAMRLTLKKFQDTYSNIFLIECFASLKNKLNLNEKILSKEFKRFRRN